MDLDIIIIIYNVKFIILFELITLIESIYFFHNQSLYFDKQNSYHKLNYFIFI